jgi:hypothetical protein
VDVVLVTCSIRADAVEQFKADFPEMPPGSRADHDLGLRVPLAPL